MFFNIDGDRGTFISGWFAADNPSVSARLAVLIPGRDEIEIEANVQRNDVRELGIHGTGQVGFLIDKSIVPDIATVVDIEIVEAESRLPVFRRMQPGRHLAKKLILFDASLLPQRRILGNIRDRFALAYFSSERYSLETMIVVISNHHAKSIAVSGRSNYNRYISYLENAGFVRAAILRDPFEELAERLLFLNLLSRSDASHLVPNFSTGLTPLLEFTRDLPFADQKAMLMRFRQATPDQRRCLASPMVRMLGCDVDEEPARRHVSVALENLAGMEVVGCRDRYDEFTSLLSQTLGGADVLGDEKPTEFSSVQSFAATLARIGVVVDLLEHDVALYALAKEAIDIGLSGPADTMVRNVQAT